MITKQIRKTTVRYKMISTVSMSQETLDRDAWQHLFSRLGTDFGKKIDLEKNGMLIMFSLASTMKEEALTDLILQHMPQTPRMLRQAVLNACIFDNQNPVWATLLNAGIQTGRDNNHNRKVPVYELCEWLQFTAENFDRFISQSDIPSVNNSLGNALSFLWNVFFPHPDNPNYDEMKPLLPLPEHLKAETTRWKETRIFELNVTGEAVTLGYFVRIWALTCEKMGEQYEFSGPLQPLIREITRLTQAGISLQPEVVTRFFQLIENDLSLQWNTLRPVANRAFRQVSEPFTAEQLVSISAARIGIATVFNFTDEIEAEISNLSVILKTLPPANDRLADRLIREITKAKATFYRRMRVSATAMQQAFDDYRRSIEVSNGLSLKDILKGTVIEKSLVSFDHLKQQRTLRIGMVSPEFMASACYPFLIGLVERMARQPEVEIFCYLVSERQPDNETRSFITLTQSVPNLHFAHFKPVSGLDFGSGKGLTPQDMAKKIRADNITVLIFGDLGLEMNNSGVKSALIMDNQPAPVIVNYLGMAGPGYAGNKQRPEPVHRIITMPSEQSLQSLQQAYREHLLPFKTSMWHYVPKGAFIATELPSLRNGYPTVAIFNNHVKWTTDFFECVHEILQKNPLVRVIFRDEECRHEEFVTAWKNKADLNQFGTRVSFEEKSGYVHYLKRISETDLAMDTWYNGTNTTLEFLLSGVPIVTYFPQEDPSDAQVVTTCMYQFIAENNPELEANIETYLIARSVQEFVAKVLALSQNKKALTYFRDTLPDAVRASSLMDGSAATELVTQCRQLAKKYGYN